MLPVPAEVLAEKTPVPTPATLNNAGFARVPTPAPAAKLTLVLDVLMSMPEPPVCVIVPALPALMFRVPILVRLTGVSEPISVLLVVAPPAPTLTVVAIICCRLPPVTWVAPVPPPMPTVELGRMFTVVALIVPAVDIELMFSRLTV